MAEKKVQGVRGLTISQCYKTSDGEVFDTLDEAKEHQIRFNFCEELEKHLKMLDMGDGERAIVTDAIMENLNGLSYIFELYTRERNANA